MAVEGYKSDKLWVTAGVKKSRPKDAYDTPRDAVRVSEFWVYNVGYYSDYYGIDSGNYGKYLHSISRCS